jgi:hypothetical protein
VSVAKSTAVARLINRYAAILLNSAKPGAEASLSMPLCAEWLTSAEGQAAIGALQRGGEQLFSTVGRRAKVTRLRHAGAERTQAKHRNNADRMTASGQIQS